MTEERKLQKQYYSYIIPSIACQLVYSAYLIVDGVFVARGVSETALAAINIAAPFLTILWALSLTFAAGTSTVAARLMGEDNLGEARKAFSRNMATMAVIGIAIAIIVLLALDPFCEILGATADTREYVRTYIETVAPFSVFFIASYTLEVLTATDGHPALATLTVSIGVVANIILDYLFIFVMDKGVWGAAFATALSQVMVIVVYMFHFFGPRAKIRFCRFDWSLRKVGSSLKRGLPSGINELSPGIILFIFIHSIQIYLGEEELVTYSAINSIVMTIIYMSVGIAQGTQPLLSYYNGSGERDKISKLMRYQIRTSNCIQIIAMALVVMLATPLVRIFITSGEALVYYSAYALKIFVSCTIFSGCNLVLANYFTSMEMPGKACIISISRCCVMLLVGIFIAVRLLGPDGIWWGMTIAEALTLIVALILYTKERQREKNF